MDGISTPALPGKLSHIARACVWVAIPTLVFVQLFVTFRGLSSPMGMEQAQVARELARGRGFHTRFMRPYAWRQLLDHDKIRAPVLDTFTPPLQPLLLAPLFKAFESFWPFNESADESENRQSIYFMDRVVASLGLVFFLGAAGMAWLTARRLFDATIAGWMFVALLACQFLWDVARSGLPQMMMLFFFSIALDQFFRAIERRANGGGTIVPALIMGLMGALMVTSHWMGAWLVLGLALAAGWQLRPPILAVALVLGPAYLVFVAWGFRNMAVCGEALGSYKGTLQSTLVNATDSWLLRDFSGNVPSASANFVIRKVVTNFAAQVQNLYAHLGGMLPAALFFVALLHPFRRPEVRAFGWSLGIIWLTAATGMSLMGLPLGEKDVNQLHSLFLPAMTAFGFAFLAVLWGRIGIHHKRSGWWSRHGLAAAACAVGALPMLTTLPAELTAGLNHKGKFSHWPPYMPRQIHKLATFTRDDELIFTDIPWAVAWYADRAAVWLPIERRQFDDMRNLAAEKEIAIAGILMTPESLRTDHVAEVFADEYRDWARLALRGIVAGFGTDLMSQVDFPYREFLPLAGQPGNEAGRFVVEMTFMSDSKRWEKMPEGEPEKKQASAMGSGKLEAAKR